jgi:S-adenosylmethionine synthetase
MKNYFITSESVTEGHPDKICDQISDAILDNLIVQDPYSRVAVECLVTTGSLHVAGEITTRGFVDIPTIARRVLREIGYNDPKFGLDADDAGIWISIHGQSTDISLGLSETSNKEPGAGDQGMMYGYACDETPELMPMPIMIAHKLTRKLAEVRKNGMIKHLGPDGKSQVTVEYIDNKPKRIDAIVIAQQHREDISEDELRHEILEKVIKPVCGKMIDEKTKVHINATGRFVIGGPEGDTGLTGRKIVVDTYGGVGRVGGGALSGKDPSKVDRSGAYMARYIAKNIVASQLAEKCEIQLSYAIGVAQPTSVNIDCFGTNKIPESELINLVLKNFDMKPRAIIEHLDLRRPIYRKTASYGHFGRADEGFFTWERTDKAEILREQAGMLNL